MQRNWKTGSAIAARCSVTGVVLRAGVIRGRVIGCAVAGIGAAFARILVGNHKRAGIIVAGEIVVEEIGIRIIGAGTVNRDQNPVARLIEIVVAVFILVVMLDDAVAHLLVT